MPLFTIINTYLAILAIFATICVIIYPYFTKSTLISHICPYLAIFALILATFAYVYIIRSYISMLVIFTLSVAMAIMCSYIEALCQIVEQLLLELLHF